MLALIVLALALAPFGLAVFGAYLGAIIWLLSQTGLHLQSDHILVLAAFLGALPLSAGLAVILVEQLCEMRAPLMSVRALAACLSVVLLCASGSPGVPFGNLVHALPAAASLSLGAFFTGLSGAILFCASASALSVVMAQLGCEALVRVCLRFSGIRIELPWASLRLLGALLISGFALSEMEALYRHELAVPRLLKISGH